MRKKQATGPDLFGSVPEFAPKAKPLAPKSAPMLTAETDGLIAGLPFHFAEIERRCFAAAQSDILTLADSAQLIRTAKTINGCRREIDAMIDARRGRGAKEEVDLLG